MRLDVNTSAVKRFTSELNKMHRSNFPIAVRETLNKAAFDVKQNTMPKSAKKEFVNRSPNFFKAFSKVEKAKGFNLSSMKATAGFVEKGLKGDMNYAVKDLVQQEFGGRIKGRSFIPTDDARHGKPGLVKTVNRFSQLGKIIKAKDINSRKARNGTNVPVKSQKEAFVIAAVKAGKGGLILAGKNPEMVFRINKIIKKSGNTKIGSTPIYSYKKGRSVNAKSTGFMKSAALTTGNKLEYFYIEEAKRRFAKGRKL